ncbi:uncharacterized protein BJX67DRAFT_373875 [Aspergillus lucknowensis]|uniref:SET domain-containing protein n=1 Tax=Aspergillus lucknowensis TaxID=176173 RepID=A0ABR4LM95_9EURO
MSGAPGEKHLKFLRWAVSRGIEINGIAPARFPGRGLGMITTRAIEEDEVMLSVPVELMLTIDSLPSEFKSRLPEGTSVHGVLTAFLMHGDPELISELDGWRAMWPAWEEFENSMPIFWPRNLRVLNSESASASQENESRSERVLLPPSISGLWNTFDKRPVDIEYGTRYQNLLAQQEKRLQDAWTHVVAAFPDTDWKTFAYHWSIIGTRSFYYISPERGEPEDWNDALAMVPFADYFNHADDSTCEARFDGKAYKFTATRRYEEGEEIYICYGSHSNDFLLVEYGFCLDNNPSDAIYLDDVIFQELAEAEQKELSAYNCLGNYEVTSSGPSKSTLAAAGLKYMSQKNWRRYVSGTAQQGFREKKTADVVQGWIRTYLRESTVAVDYLTKLSNTAKLAIILSRWEQIQRICEGALATTTN